MSASTSRKLPGFLLMSAALLCAACSDDDDDNNGGPGGGGFPPTNGESEQRTLSGVVRAEDGSPWPGAVITLPDGTEVEADGAGRFVLHDPPVGQTVVTVDPGTASTTEPQRFPADVDPAGASQVDRPIYFVDPMSSTDAAFGTVSLDPGGSGATIEPITVTGAGTPLRLDGRSNTVIEVDGQPALGMLDLAAWTIEPYRVAAPVGTDGQDLDAAVYFRVSPETATFNSAGNGLDAVLPNPAGYPSGTVLDLYSFDVETGEWTETRAIATVGPDGTTMTSCGGVTAGGLWASAIAVNPGCTTTVVGRVVDIDGDPVENASIVLQSGQGGHSGEDGTFTILGVPAYDASSLPNCVATVVGASVFGPPPFNEMRFLGAPAGAAIPNGTTDLGDIPVELTGTGAISGRVTDGGTPIPNAMIELDGPTQVTIDAGPQGTFFDARLAPGNYEARFTYPGDTEESVAEFSVEELAITTLEFQRSQGSGGDDLTVRVVVDDDGVEATAPVAASGAKVLLSGTDSGSQGGIVHYADDAGVAHFQSVDGPYTITAIVDMGMSDEEGGSLARRAVATVVDVEPTGGTIGIPIDFRGPQAALPPADAQITGTVDGLGTTDDEFLVEAHAREFDYSAEANVDQLTGQYTLSVPAGVLIDAALVRREKVAGADGPRVVSIIPAPGLMASQSGEIVLEDFDLAGPDVIPFDRQVNVGYANLLGAGAETTANLWLGSPAGAQWSFELAAPSTASAPPDTWFLPQPGDSDVMVLDPRIEVRQTLMQGADELESTWTMRVEPDLTDLVTVDLYPPPTIDAPLASSSVQGIQGLLVDWTTAVTGPSDGYDEVRLFETGGQGLGGLDTVDWTLWVPTATEMVTLPELSESVFQSDAEVGLEVTAVRMSEVSFDFDELFDEDVVENLTQLEGDYERKLESSTERSFTVE